jgi:hypothetical protein
MNRDYFKLIADCTKRSDVLFQITEHDSNGPISEKGLLRLSHPEWIPEQFLDNARQNDGYTLQWETRPGHPERPACEGAVRLLPMRTMLRKWKGHIYFGWPEEPKRRRAFKVVDFFVNEACVGFYHDAQRDPGLYFFQLGEGVEPYPLHLDLKGYLTLLNYTMGYRYWPLAALRQLPDDGRNPSYRSSLDFLDRFRRDLGAWVPEFTYEEFVALYQQLKLRDYTPSLP